MDLSMGGYAAFVWPAYGFAVVVLAGLWLSSVRGVRARERELADVDPAVRRREGR